MAWVGSRDLGALPLPNLPPKHQLSALLGEVLALWNQTLMNGAGQEGDAAPADLIVEVLAGNAEVMTLRFPSGLF